MPAPEPGPVRDGGPRVSKQLSTKPKQDQSWAIALSWWWGAGPMAPWCASGLEGLDDDHGSAAAGTGLGEGRRFRVIGGVGVIGLGDRHAEQLADTGDVAGTENAAICGVTTIFG